MNTNSIESFKSERDSGKITKKQQEVINWLKKNKYGTAREISQDIPGAWRRCSELAVMGKVIVVDNPICPITNKKVAMYGLAITEPNTVFTSKVKKPTRKQLIDKINELELNLRVANSEAAHAYNDGIRVGLNMGKVNTVARWFKLW